MGAGSAAVAAAQAQAVSNTSLQLQHQNRRGSGAGLKSSYGVALKSPHVPEYIGNYNCKDTQPHRLVVRLLHLVPTFQL